MLVIPLSQHYTATIIIHILRHQTVKLYEKTSVVLYSTEIKFTSLRFSNDYSFSLLNNLASAYCLMIPSAFEVQHL